MQFDLNDQRVHQIHCPNTRVKFRALAGSKQLNFIEANEPCWLTPAVQLPLLP